jgi:3-hydroxybutyrate dehydrogenase
MDLEGRVAIITGGDGGLGRTMREVFAREGAHVVPVDLHGDGCFQADVGTADGNRAMIEETIRRHGRLDILVLNAGTQLVAPIADYPESEWDRLMNVMAKGPFLAMKYAWPSLTARPGGRIIAIGSVLSVKAEPFKPAYVAAKHAVLGLIRVAALEGAAFGLTANTVAPGWMHTSIVERQLADQMRLRGLTREQVIEHMVGSQPGKRFVETKEVADLVAFLASARSSGITGACLPVDLGALAI